MSYLMHVQLFIVQCSCVREFTVSHVDGKLVESADMKSDGNVRLNISANSATELQIDQ